MFLGNWLKSKCRSNILHHIGIINLICKNYIKLPVLNFSQAVQNISLKKKLYTRLLRVFIYTETNVITLKMFIINAENL